MAFLVLVALLIPVFAHADMNENVPKQAKYEVGAAAGLFYLPDYPGADESRARFIALPYLFYRGDIFRADREGGVRGRLINQDKIEFDFSAAAAFPTNSEENKAREGMEDLDWIGEIGPRFVYHIHRSRHLAWDFKLPIRYVFSTDLGFWKERGFTINPQLLVRHQTEFDPMLFFTAKVEGTSASKKLMSYLYSVEAKDVTADRSEYHARSGYMGTTASLSALKVLPRYDVVVFGSVSWDFYQESVNRNSPLLRDTSTTSYNIGIAWSFYKSEEKED